MVTHQIGTCGVIAKSKASIWTATEAVMGQHHADIYMKDAAQGSDQYTPISLGDRV